MNVKYFILSVFFVLTFSLSKGQNFSKISQENIYHFAMYADALSNGDILILDERLRSYYSNSGLFPELSNLVNDLNDVENTLHKIQKLNSKLEIVKEVTFKSNTDSLSWVLNFQIDEPDNEIVVLVANIMADTTKFYMHWYNLDLKQRHTLAVPSEYRLSSNWVDGWHFIINENNNIVYPGRNGFHEFNRFGENINSYYYTFNEVYGPPSPFIIQNSLGGYFSTNPQLKNYSSFNANLEFIEGVDYHNLQEPRISVRRDCNRLAISTNKETAYVTAFVRIKELEPCDTTMAGIFHYDEFVYKYNLIEPDIPELFFVDTTDNCNYSRYGVFAIDLFHDDYIYYSHSDKDCGFIAPPAYDPTCYVTYITLKCLDEAGNLRWSKYLGGDAAYLPQGVVATPDSGVVVFVLRHHPDENERYAADIYAAKFDKNGQSVDLPNAGLVAVNEVNLNNKIKVYPNPVIDYFIVEGIKPSKQNIIKLYNSTGQLILNKNIVGEKIDVSSLQKGYYTYAIFKDVVLTKAGKLLK